MTDPQVLPLAPRPPLRKAEVCYGATFFNISSYGIFEEYETPGVIFEHALPLLEIQIILIFVSIVLCHMFLRRIGIPQFVSHMLAGFILGPQLFDLVEFSSDRLSLDVPGDVALEGVARFGLVMFTFLMGVKTNKKAAFQTDRRTIIIAVSTFLVTMISGLAFRNFRLDKVDPLYMPLRLAPTERTVIAAVQALTLLPVITHLVYELKIPNSELGRIAISIAAINDLLGFTTLICVSYVGTYRYVSPSIANRDMVAMIILVLVILFIVKPMAQRIVDITPEGKPVPRIYLYATIMTAIAASIYSEFFNQIHVLGAFLVGMAIPDGPPLGSALEDKFESLVTNIFFPISIAVMTMKGDVLRALYSFDDISFNIVLVILTSVVKWTATFVPCMICKLPMKESVIIATIMNYKGFVDLCFLDGAVKKKNLTQATYTFMMIYVLLNAGILPTIVKALYDPKRKYIGYVKRDIMHLKSNSDLKILTCLHKPDNISGAISLLKLISLPLNNENKDRRVIAVTTLYLVKLAGRMFPILIPHDKRSKARSLQNSYIQTMMLAFNEFQQENWESLTINSFTAYSHEDLMDQDICNLALDQLTSMIIVPSGRRWSPDGSYESEDIMIRRVNASLLDRAPCSIGVLNYRGYHKGKKRTNSTINVGVIFIGGKDDREALSLVKWMRQNPRVCLTVTRFLSGQEPNKSKNWDYLIDDEVLNDLKATYSTVENFSYVEKIVTGGPAVATTVRLVAKDNDLVIVGRGHDDESMDFTGLAEWMELPELGVIGDLLASKELRSRVSVLVVQQQQKHE
ncbi:PREDICTED: cation/H(+) antiporter 9-like [Camelina sativa]|uniref:Cation/H(+) antiporter 9-like n=1 Tax=Camelina sativa TaxID=90675 RepID=A0ABM1QTJ7_CAMSA|nr:PREDICTED: cation/H(+) antiporter 9-like [Camelina sativa]